MSTRRELLALGAGAAVSPVLLGGPASAGGPAGWVATWAAPPTNLAYDSGDHLRPNDAAMAAAVPLRLFR